MATQKVLHVGNSLAVTLPSRFAKALSVKVGDEIEVTQQTDNSITFTFTHPHQLTLTPIKNSPSQESKL